MTGSTPPTSEPGVSTQKASDKPVKAAFAFTDPGCRPEIRFGALLILAGVFLWLWLGPGWSNLAILVGTPFLLIGVPCQVRDARRKGRPGYPWKLGLTLGIFGLIMVVDLMWRERPGGALSLQVPSVFLAAAGLYILAWWPMVIGRKGEMPA